MRVGFDMTPLASPHPPGVVRVAERLVAAVEDAGRLEVVRLVPEPGQGARAFRRTLPARVRAEGLAGIHGLLSAFQPRGPGLRVQTIHECPWRHGVEENAGWRHRLWARVGPRLADAVVTPSQHTARDLGLRPREEGGKGCVVPWGVDARFAPDPPDGEIDEVLLGRYRLPERALVLCVGATPERRTAEHVFVEIEQLHDFLETWTQAPGHLQGGLVVPVLDECLEAGRAGDVGSLADVDEVEFGRDRQGFQAG